MYNAKRIFFKSLFCSPSQENVLPTLESQVVSYFTFHGSNSYINYQEIFPGGNLVAILEIYIGNGVAYKHVGILKDPTE